MAETLISPGVLARENDQSQITSQPVTVGSAIIGPTVKGKPNIPKIVTSYSEYVAEFGSQFESGSQTYTHLTSYSAYNFFQNGGESLLVTRVASGSFTAATSSLIRNHADATSSSFSLESLGQGTILNSTGTEGTNNVLTNGTVDNFRWEIVSPNTSSGTFSLLVRRGDDNIKQKVILETYSNLSLDPKQPNYIERVIGNQTQELRGSGTDLYLQVTGSYPNASKYIRVKEVTNPTPDYFDNNGIAKDAFTGSIPTATSGTFGDADGDLFGSRKANFYQDINNTDTQGLTGPNYTDAINLLANRDEYRYKVITAPGLIYENASHATPLNLLISNTETRGDAIVVTDLVGYNQNVTTVTGTAASIDSSFVATYWPWVQVNNQDNPAQLVFIPASTLIPGVYAFNDNSSEAWFAPAGINRGGLSTVRQAERKLTSSNRDTLYTANVNPIATFPGRGVVVFGQKTLQKRASALDRINVRRLLIELKSFISQVADNLVFEQNTQATRNNFLSQVNPFLESVQQRQGLYAFRVVMDETNNTADVIDRNQLVGQIYIQPTRTAEFVLLDFNILPTGAVFPQ